MTSKAPSARAREFWKRMLSWYGARLGDQFGLMPPQDWADSIDSMGRGVLEKVSAEILRHHPLHPPTYPQFQRIVQRLTQVTAQRPSTAERLADFIVAHRKLTPHQLRGGWTFHYAENECVFVEVPGDGDAPGFRVRVEDLPHDA